MTAEEGCRIGFILHLRIVFHHDLILGPNECFMVKSLPGWGGRLWVHKYDAIVGILNIVIVLHVIWFESIICVAVVLVNNLDCHHVSNPFAWQQSPHIPIIVLPFLFSVILFLLSLPFFRELNSSLLTVYTLVFSSPAIASGFKFRLCIVSSSSDSELAIASCTFFGWY